jgi:hypothetical protein
MAVDRSMMASGGIIKQGGFEYHDPKHRPSCSKKNSECRFLFPKLPHTETKVDDNTRESDITLHRLVEGKEINAKPWLIYPK